MSNIIPPLLSTTPPPMDPDPGEEEEDDEFGDFRTAVDLSFNCDGLSLPPTPDHAPKADSNGPKDSLDINSNNDNETHVEQVLEKDFQDKRKIVLEGCSVPCKLITVVNNIETQIESLNVVNIERDMSDNLNSPTASVSEPYCNGTEIVDDTSEISDSFNEIHHKRAIDSNHVNLTEKSSSSVGSVQSADEENNVQEGQFNYFIDVPNESKINIGDFEVCCAQDLDNNSEKLGSADCTGDLQHLVKGESVGLDIDDSKGLENQEKHSDGVCINNDCATSLEQYDTDCFGDFEDHIKEENMPDLADAEVRAESDIQSPNAVAYSKSEKHFEEDDFGCFSNFVYNESSPSVPLEEPKGIHLEPAGIDKTKRVSAEDDFADFEDFREANVQEQSQVDVKSVEGARTDFEKFEADFSDNQANYSRNDEDDFGDFEDYTLSDAAQTQRPDKNQQDFEFGSFDNWPTSQIPEESTTTNYIEVIKKIFPEVALETENCTVIDFLEENSIFEELKDITETSALKFQWVQSVSQKMLLQALNIDTRNILYGPGWNPSMPKFAANLSLNPLEPLKPEVVNPSSSSHQNETVPSSNSDVPSVNFDWGSSGLVNPLDSVQSESSEKPASSILDVDFDFMVDKKEDVITPTLPSKYSPNLQRSPVKDHHVVSDSFNELPKESSSEISGSKHQSTVLSRSDFDHMFTQVMMPLRETHISNDASDDVRPDVLTGIKDSISDNNLKSITSETTHAGCEVNEEEDEFDDFQMVMPEKLHENVAISSKTEVKLDILTPLEPVKLEPLKPTVVPNSTGNIPSKIEWPDPGLSEDDLKRFELTYTKADTPKEQPKKESPKREVQKKDSQDEDDWTDFVCNPQPATQNLQLSVLNLNHVQPVKPPVPVVTPQGLVQTRIPSNGYVPPRLQPLAPHFSPQKSKPNDGYQFSTISNQFSKEFFGSVNPNIQTNNHFITNNFVVNHPSPISFSEVPTKEDKKDLNNDDDDWTDFISSQPTSQPVQQQIWPFPPNIITNPAHFEHRSSDMLNRNSAKSTVASIASLPDLDFVIKNRTMNGKK